MNRDEARTLLKQMGRSEDNGASGIHAAANAGSLTEVAAWLGIGIGVNTPYKSSIPLLRAVEGGHEDLVDFLLENGADINAQDIVGDSTLQLAMNINRTGMLERLLKKGCLANRYNHLGRTPLFCAIRSSLKETKLLLEHGADPDFGVEDGLSAMMWAIDFSERVGVSSLIALLMDAGADVDRIVNRRTPLSYAISQKNNEAVSCLLAHGADPNRIDGFGWTPLMTAELRGMNPDDLIAQGACAQNHDLKNLYVKITNGGSLEECKTLIGRVGVDATSFTGATPLMWSALTGDRTFLNYLLEHEADVGARDVNGDNAAAYAARSRRSDILALVLNAGAPVNDSAGQCSFLSEFVTNEIGLFAILRQLLKAGANPNSLNGEGYRTLDVAISVDGESVMDGCAPNLDSIRALLEAGAEANDCGLREAERYQKGIPEWWQAPLMASIALNRTDLVELLFDFGADPNACDDEGQSPLHHAALFATFGEGDYSALAALLLSKGADASLIYNNKIARQIADDAGVSLF